jgi:hypothetical protein
MSRDILGLIMKIIYGTLGKQQMYLYVRFHTFKLRTQEDFEQYQATKKVLNGKQLTFMTRYPVYLGCMHAMCTLGTMLNSGTAEYGKHLLTWVLTANMRDCTLRCSSALVRLLKPVSPPPLSRSPARVSFPLINESGWETHGPTTSGGI